MENKYSSFGMITTNLGATLTDLGSIDHLTVPNLKNEAVYTYTASALHRVNFLPDGTTYYQDLNLSASTVTTNVLAGAIVTITSPVSGAIATLEYTTSSTLIHTNQGEITGFVTACSSSGEYVIPVTAKLTNQPSVFGVALFYAAFPNEFVLKTNNKVLKEATSFVDLMKN
ncbi:MAG: hypothetical protein KW802_01315 [Candidatus Doudnabacteria bacterium]|nr:hypothetical protein [Candidatus Doudnabacteria bacterium]